MRSFLAVACAALIAGWAPIVLAAGILATIPGAPAILPIPSPPGPAPTVAQITVGTNSSPFTSPPSATFGSSPAVGDWLVAVTDGDAGSVTAASGWTQFYTGPNCHTYGPQVIAAYRQVQSGDGATFTPFTAGGIAAVAIYDVSGAQSTWAAAYQQTYGTCATSSDPLTVSGETGGPNTLVLAANYAFIPTEDEFTANPGLTGITGDLQTTYVNNGGNNAAGVAAAWASYSGFTLASATGSMTPLTGCGFCGLGVALIMFNNGP